MNKKLSLKNMLPVIIGTVGILIMLLGSTLTNKTTVSQTSDFINTYEELETYTKSLENKIKTLCESCDGINNVSVAITFNGGFEYEYAKNTEYGDNNYGSDRREEFLVIGQGSNQKCVLLRQKLPEISGVGIVCNGADNEKAKHELIMLVSSTLNIGINKIYVTEAS